MRVAEFSSTSASSGESGSGKTQCLVYLTISDFPKAVLAAVGGGGGADTGETRFLGTTI